ncbi:MAG: hypothetical protein LBB94_01945 [Clostridiales bacterium]|jgi:hypothetical protein|nr:hypothetical protein [Clostridiales bacterium]
MKNHLENLELALFETLEIVSDRDLESDALQEELNRAKTILFLARELLKCGELALKAARARDACGADFKLPGMIDDAPLMGFKIANLEKGR